MELTAIISRIFSVLFILILFYFIFRSLYLMRQDKTVGLADPRTGTLPEWGLLVLETAEGSRLLPGSVIPLAGEITMGRKPDNHVVLEDPFISSYHVQFFDHDGRYVIEDLSSTNGTLLNMERLDQSTYLETNDIITLGSTVFRVVSRGGNHA